MARAGPESLFPMDELSLFGFAEVLPHVPRLATAPARDRGARSRRRRPDAGADHRRAGLRAAAAAPPAPACRCCACTTSRRRSGRGGPAAPRGWPAIVDHLLALLPFEPPYFERLRPRLQLRRPSDPRGGADAATARASAGATALPPMRRCCACCPAAGAARSPSICRVLGQRRATCSGSSCRGCGSCCRRSAIWRRRCAAGRRLAACR